MDKPSLSPSVMAEPSQASAGPGDSGVGTGRCSTGGVPAHS